MAMPWLLLAALLSQDSLLYDRDREALDRYFDSARVEVELVLLPDGQPRPNAYGHYALGYGGQPHNDLELLNPAFFHHVDWAVKRATGKGLRVKLVAPGASSGFAADKRAEFARYLRKRYERNRRITVIDP